MLEISFILLVMLIFIQIILIKWRSRYSVK